MRALYFFCQMWSMTSRHVLQMHRTLDSGVSMIRWRDEAVFEKIMY